MTDKRTPFSQQISHIARGSLDDTLTDELSELVKAINDTRRGGEISLKLKLKPKVGANGEVVMIDIQPEYQMKPPAMPILGATMYPTYDGDLLRSDPDQAELDLQTVPEKPQETVRLDTDG